MRPPVDAPRADLADDDEVVAGTGAERGPDAAVHLAVRVERRGVDVVDAELDGAAQQGDGVLGRRRLRLELHGAVADPGDLELSRSGPVRLGVVSSVMALLGEILDKDGGTSA